MLLLVGDSDMLQGRRAGPRRPLRCQAPDSDGRGPTRKPDSDGGLQRRVWAAGRPRARRGTRPPADGGAAGEPPAAAEPCFRLGPVSGRGWGVGGARRGRIPPPAPRCPTEAAGWTTRSRRTRSWRLGRGRKPAEAVRVCFFCCRRRRPCRGRPVTTSGQMASCVVKWHKWSNGLGPYQVKWRCHLFDHNWSNGAATSLTATGQMELPPL